MRSVKLYKQISSQIVLDHLIITIIRMNYETNVGGPRWLCVLYESEERY